MGLEPPRYPRIPHLLGHVGLDEDDVVLQRTALARWLSLPVTVEEKLDGANVCLWPADGAIRVVGRSRGEGRDRGNQLGPLRAWVAERSGRLLDVLGVDKAVYGEWLWQEHSVAYDSLPQYLIGIDVWRPGVGFLDVAARNAVLDEAGLARPPVVHQGPIRHLSTLNRLLSARSQFSRQRVEGLIIRAGGEERELVKVLRPDFRRLSDADWDGGRPRNRLRSPDDQ